MSKEAMQQALEALESVEMRGACCDTSLVKASKTAIRAALAEQAQLANTCNGMPMYEGPLSASRRQDTTPPAPVAPPGWRMVPVEPTQEMLDKAWQAMQGNISAGVTWAAMLAAAPEAPTPPEPQPLPEIGRTGVE